MRGAGTSRGRGQRALLLILAGGCAARCSSGAPPAATPSATTPASRPAPAAGDAAAESALQTLTERVASAKSVRIKGRIQSVETVLEGTLVARADGPVSIEFAGDYRGGRVEVFLASDGTTARGGPRGREFKQGVPASFRRDLLATVAARGLTQPVTDLFTGSLGGDVAARIRLSNLATGQRYLMKGREAQALNFDVVYADEAAGQGTLWLAVDTGLPVGRGLYVRRPRETILLETYDVFELGGD
jgi:hypothetical protein